MRLDKRRKMWYNTGMEREMGNTCPKCGTEGGFTTGTSYLNGGFVFHCDTSEKGGIITQSDKCRIRKLVAELEKTHKLSAEHLEQAIKMQAQSEDLADRNATLRDALRTALDEWVWYMAHSTHQVHQSEHDRLLDCKAALAQGDITCHLS